jgi:hypothetical protein
VQEIFISKTKIESGMPGSYEFLANGLLWAIADVKLMFKWFADEGYAANIPEVKNVYPELLEWASWLEKESTWVERS